MCKRSLSVLIASALFGAGAAIAQTAPPAERAVQPPPAAAASVHGQTSPATQVAPCPDETDAERRARLERGEPLPCPEPAAEARADFAAADADYDDASRQDQRPFDADPEDYDQTAGQPPPQSEGSPMARSDDDRHAQDGTVAHTDRQVYSEYDEDDDTLVASDRVVEPMVGPPPPAQPGDPMYRDPAERTAAAAADTTAGVYSDGIADERTVAGTTADRMDYAEQPITDRDLQPDEPVEVRQAEGEPFASTAGTEGFSSGATAQTAEQHFNQLDRDNSGELTREQVEDTGLAARFDEYDINDDGTISENEFQSWFAAQRDLQSGEVDTAIAASDDERDEFDDSRRASTADASADTTLDVDRQQRSRTAMTTADPASADADRLTEGQPQSAQRSADRDYDDDWNAADEMDDEDGEDRQ
jgi:hypothetical protein